MARLLAWLVHLYTALGLLCAAGMAVLIVRGGDASFRWAFALMVAATIVDATDGWLARHARVKEVLPHFDGRSLDDLIDFHTYTSMPLLLLWRAGIPPDGFALVLLVPLLASAYGFSQVNAKTDDGFFLGFPSYWNIIAFYMYVLRPSTPLVVGTLVVFSVLTFLPTPYLYATRGGPFARTMNLGAAAWAIALGVILVGPPEWARPLTLGSLLYPALYLGLSATVAARRGPGPALR